MELWQEIQKKQEELNKAVNDLKVLSRNYGMAYRRYRILLAKELLKLRAEGMPVTMSSDVARGKEEIALAKEQEIITEGLYKSCLEAINVYKIQIKILNDQYNREWGNVRNE